MTHHDHVDPAAAGNPKPPPPLTTGQQAYVARFKRAVALISEQTPLALGVKDTESRHITGTDAHGRLVGLRRGPDAEGRLDADMPCEGTARFATSFMAEDRAVMAGVKGASMRILNVHEFSTGFGAVITHKSQLRDPETGRVLGAIFCCHEVDLAPLLAYLPRNGNDAALGCSARIVEGEQRFGSIALNEQEHEICFLLAAGWNGGEIAALLDRTHPGPRRRDAAGIDRLRGRLCDRLGIPGLDLRAFREMLISAGQGSRMPASLVRHLIGSSPIDSMPTVH